MVLKSKNGDGVKLIIPKHLSFTKIFLENRNKTRQPLPSLDPVQLNKVNYDKYSNYTQYKMMRFHCAFTQH